MTPVGVGNAGDNVALSSFVSLSSTYSSCLWLWARLFEQWSLLVVFPVAGFQYFVGLS